MFTSNRSIRFTAATIILAVTFWGSSARAQVQVQPRILSQIKNEERVTVKGSTSPLVKASVDSGRMAGGQNLGRMVLALAPSPEQEQAAAQLVAAQHDSSSPFFHKWLAPAEFGQQFGVAADDATKIEQWLQGQGLTVHEVAQSRRFIVFSGTVTQVEQAFSTEMHSYSYKNRKFIANASEVQIPAALAPVVKGIVRLNSDPRRSNVYMGGKVHFNKKTGHFESDTDGGHYMAPADFAKIYNVQPLYDAGIDGSGQTIAIVGRSNIVVQDVTNFRSLLGLPANDPQVIVNGDDPGQTGDMPEAMLDVTWSGAVAPMAKVILVVSQSNFADGVDTSASYIVDQNLAPVVSMSFGACESDLGPAQNDYYNLLWQQAAAQGITVFVSSGDSGGAGCDAPGGGLYASGGVAVNGLGSTPYNISVGGTQFDDTDNPSTYWASTNDPVTGGSALGYIPEVVWNESSNDPNFVLLFSGGGGVSSVYTKPAWQAAPGVPNDGMRDTPDISLTAALHDGYLVCLSDCAFGPYFYSFGGTSASSPAAAGIMALVNQKQSGQRQGLANYVFYKLASVPGVYHDTIKGDNKVPDSLGQFTVGYDAGTGYDLATGLGSFDANALVNHWASAASASGSTTTLALGSGQSASVVHGSPIAFQAKVSCTGAGCTAPTGAVALLATPATGPAVGVGGGALTSASPTSLANLTTEKVPGGSYNMTATYSGDGKYYASTSNSVPVTVSPEPSQTYLGMIGGGSFTTAPLSIAYGTHQQIGIIVAGDSGAGYPSGQLSLQADGNPVSTISFDPGTGNTNPNLLILNYGEHSAIVSPSVTAISQSSTISYLEPSTSLGVGTHQLQATYPGDASFSSSVSNTYSYNVTKAVMVIGDFFPLGEIVPNLPVHFLGQTGFSDFFSFAPYTGSVTISDITSGSPVILGSAPITMDYGGFYDVPVTFPAVGTYKLLVDFSGDANTKSASSRYQVSVTPNAAPYVYVATDPSTAALGSPVTITAVVVSTVSAHSIAGQSVTFSDGTTVLGTAVLGGPPVNQGGGAMGYSANLVVSTLTGGVHSLTASYAGDAVLTAADSTSGPVTVMISDYTIQAQPAGMTIQAGQSGTTTLNIIPLGGSTQTVQLACGTLPADISCTFSPASVTLNGFTAASVKVTVNTNINSARAVTKSPMWGAASTLAFAGILLPFIRRKKLKTMLGMASILFIVLCGVGCSSGSSSSNAAKQGIYVVDVTASGGAGSVVKTVPLVVTVVK